MTHDQELEDIRARRLEARIDAPGLRLAEGPVALTDEDFDEVVGNGGIVVVDFWAPWCMPCRMLGPTIEELAAKYAGRITVAKVNTDENPRVPTRLGIYSIPTVIFFKDGAPVEKSVGLVPLKELERAVDALLD